MDATDHQDLIDDLRKQRLQDPDVIKNGHCAECEYRGYHRIEGSDMVRTCECAMNKAVRGRLDRVGVPRRFHGMAFDAILQAEGQGWSRGRISFLKYVKAGYVQGLDRINAGQRIRLDVGVTRRIHSVALVGGPRRIKSAWASQTVEEKGTHPGAFAYYQFGELRSMLSDFKRMDEQQEFVDVMGSYDLVILDGVYGGACAPGFPAAWDAGIATRQNSGLATILLCEDDHAIDSYAWRDLLDDPEMLVLPFSLEGQAAPSAAASQEKRAVPPANSRPQVREVTTQDDAEAAILDYLMAYPDKIVKLIYDNIPAPREIVKAALDSLEAKDDVLKRLKPGKSGTMTVYYVRPEADDQPSRVKPPTANKQPVADKQLTYTELEEITQVPRTTLFRWRKAGLSDDEIVSRAEAERVP